MPDDLQTAARETARETAALKGVIPSLSFDGAASDAAAFYVRAFGARDIGRIADDSTPGRLMHCALELNGGGLMMTDCRAPWETEAKKPQGMTLQLIVEDGDAWWTRAVDAGCKVLMPFETMFWGDRWGMLEDPFGIGWAIDEPAR